MFLSKKAMKVSAKGWLDRIVDRINRPWDEEMKKREKEGIPRRGPSGEEKEPRHELGLGKGYGRTGLPGD